MERSGSGFRHPGHQLGLVLNPALPAEIRSAHDLSSLRTVWHLAAPCPVWLKKAWIGWLGPNVIWELYAGTEAQARTDVNGRESWVPKTCAS